MNILHLCTKVPFPAKDGGSLATLAFASLLQSQGFHITILAANTPKHIAEPNNQGQSGIELHSVFVNTNIFFPAMVFNYMFTTEPYNVTRFRSKKFKAYLIQLLTSVDFDVIQLEGPHLGIYLSVIRKYSTARVVLRAHNVEHLLWENLADDSDSIFKKLYFRNLAKRLKKFEKVIISEVDGVIPISNHDLKQLLTFATPKQFTVIPFHIDAGNYIPDDNVQENTLFFIGALDWVPNQEGLTWFLDEVWPAVKKKLPDLSFHIAGRNTPDRIKAKFDLQDVYFHGEVSNAVDFMKQFQVMIVPLFSGSGVRVKIMEGMALKKPVISTSKGAEGLEVTTGNELLIANNPVGFVDCILTLINDKFLRQSLGETARMYICKEFDQALLAKNAGIFYRKLKEV